MPELKHSIPSVGMLSMGMLDQRIQIGDRKHLIGYVGFDTCQEECRSWSAAQFGTMVVRLSAKISKSRSHANRVRKA